MPRLKKADRERLFMLAESMINEASSSGGPRILSATGYSRSSISILHQQMRCANLAWALKYTGRLKTGDVIGIVGGSFSGLMLASALAMCNDVIVYIFEKERRLMQRFLEKSHRFISPNLNSRSLRKAFHPTEGVPFYDPPIFRWEGDAASTIAVDWRNEFKAYADKLPIFCLFGRGVDARHIKATPEAVEVQFDALNDGTQPSAIKLDWLIDATGFGAEANHCKLEDYSYWESGHRLVYEYLRPKARVLVSGCGDSGIVELMHYAIKGFSHARISDFWPPARHLDLVIDQNLERVALDDVTAWEDDWDLDALPLSSELRWFRGICRYGAGDYHGGPSDLDPVRQRIFAAIENVLLESCLKKRTSRGDLEAYFSLVPQASLKDQDDVRRALAPILDEESSLAIRDAMQSIHLAKIFNLKKLHGLRSDTHVVLNDKTPTPFTRQLSPFNIWLTYVMLSFPNVSYHQGELKKVDCTRDGTCNVRFAGGSRESFDRVVTRYGPTGGSHLFSSKSGLEPAGYLLLSPEVMISKGNAGWYVDLATQEIKLARQRLAKRRVSRSSDHHIEKAIFASLLDFPEKSRTRSNELQSHSQAALVEMLRAGTRARFSQSERW